MTALVIADRDGTLIEDKHYLSSPDMISVIPGVMSGMKLLEESNIALVVATNQSGVGRGYFVEECVIEVNNRCQSLIDPHRKVLKHFFTASIVLSKTAVVVNHLRAWLISFSIVMH